MIEISLNGSLFHTVYGLTQYDYGRYIKFISDPVLVDGTEVQFYQTSLSGVMYTKDGAVKVPDKLLENGDNIIAYVYIKQEGLGETVSTIVFKVQKRPKPESYILPDYDEGGGTDYNTLQNKPTVNGVELKGNKTIEDLGEHTITNSELNDIVNYQYNLIFGGTNG